VGPGLLTVFCVKISFGVWVVASLKNQKTNILWSYISRIWGEKPLVGSAQNFALGDIQDIITDANLGDDQLSHFCVARGQILGFSIGFRSRPYNTLALPCESVIMIVHVYLICLGMLHYLTYTACCKQTGKKSRLNTPGLRHYGKLVVTSLGLP